MEKYQRKKKHVPKQVYTINLPIPVQTNPDTLKVHGRSFARFKKRYNEEMPTKQNLLIIRCAGVCEDFHTTSIVVLGNYESE